MILLFLLFGCPKKIVEEVPVFVDTVPTLCLPDERALVGCAIDTEPPEIASLCRTPAGDLAFRYRVGKELVLAYPGPGETAVWEVRGETVPRGEWKEIGFSYAGSRFALYEDALADGGPPEPILGLRRQDGRGVVTDRPCDRAEGALPDAPP